MPKKSAIQLVLKIILAIVCGSLIGKFLTVNSFGVFSLRSMITFSDLFSQFIAFFIPLVVILLILPGIIELGSRASKLLLIAIGICYASMLFAGFISFFIGQAFIPKIFSGLMLDSQAILDNLYLGFLPKILRPFLDVLGAIVIAFSFGIAAASVKSTLILQVSKELEKCMYVILNKFLIPLLPFYICFVFAKLSATGELAKSLQNFALIMLIIFIIANTLTLMLIFITALVCKKKFFHIIKSYTLAYFVAFGTQSSKATIPTSLEAAKNLGISKEVADFAVPLLATIHLLGSMVTQIFGAMAIYYVFTGEMLSPSLMISYIFLIATILLAAPGIPGGEPVATKPLLTSFLGFPPVVAETMFTLGIANDSFATSINVTSDSFVIMLIEKVDQKYCRNSKTC